MANFVLELLFNVEKKKRTLGIYVANHATFLITFNVCFLSERFDITYPSWWILAEMSQILLVWELFQL